MLDSTCGRREGVNASACPHGASCPLRTYADICQDAGRTPSHTRPAPFFRQVAALPESGALTFNEYLIRDLADGRAVGMRRSRWCRAGWEETATATVKTDQLSKSASQGSPRRGLASRSAPQRRLVTPQCATPPRWALSTGRGGAADAITRHGGDALAGDGNGDDDGDGRLARPVISTPAALCDHVLICLQRAIVRGALLWNGDRSLWNTWSTWSI